jgi:hypothetical protein
VISFQATQKAGINRINIGRKNCIIMTEWAERSVAVTPTPMRLNPERSNLKPRFLALARLPRVRVGFSLPRSRLGRGWGGVFNSLSNNSSRRWLSSSLS